METIYFGRNLESVIPDRAASGMEVKSEIQIVAFIQMLAKIAYGYMVASQGLFPRDETPLLPLIRGEIDDYSTWVGSNNYNLQIESNGSTHALGGYFSRNSENILSTIVQIKLFSSAGATGYEVATHIPGWQKYKMQKGS